MRNNNLTSAAPRSRTVNLEVSEVDESRQILVFPTRATRIFRRRTPEARPVAAQNMGASWERRNPTAPRLRFAGHGDGRAA